MGIRLELHPQNNSNKFPSAIYTLSKDQQRSTCEFIKSVRVPDGYSSNISGCVNVDEPKITGLKSHDCHVLMQVLLPLALRGIIPKDVVDPIMELSRYFKIICSKVLDDQMLIQWENDIAIILCKLEQIPPFLF